jgi:hypothetical protein
MAQYTLTKIDDKLWRKFKAVCAIRGETIRKFFIDRIKESIKEKVGKNEQKT